MTTGPVGLRFLFVPADRIFEVQHLLSLPTPTIADIADALRSRDSLKSLQADAQPVVEAIVARAGLPRVQALSVWYAVLNLATQRRDLQISDADFLDDLTRLMPSDGPSMDAAKRAALVQLFTTTREGYLVQKAQFLRTAFTPTLVSCRSVCDIRPLFDEAHQRIEGAALVVLLGLETHTNEHDVQTVVVQATRAKLAELKKCIADAETKLALMERDFGGKVEFF
jgi:hypothetical protein